MITLRLYKNFNKRENSTKQPANTEGSYTDFTCCIKDNSTITRPVIDLAIVSGDPASLGYNYAYIAAYNRYYFVTEWTYALGIWTCHLSVDVLASYKTAIGALSKYVTRSASQYDLDVQDSTYPAKTGTTQTIMPGVNPFSLTNGCYVLGLVGKQPTANVPCIGGVCYYILTPSQMVEFINYMMDDAFAQMLEDPAAGLTDAVVKAIFNPMEYISSCMYIPFTVATPATAQPQIGWWLTAPITGGAGALGAGGASSMIKSPTATLTSFSVPRHPQYTRGHYLDLEPYSTYEFYLEPWGSIPLDSRLVSAYNTITYSVNVDLVTGFGRLTIYGNGNKELATSLAQVGVPIQISQIMTDVVAGMQQSIATLGSALGALGGGNVGGAIANVANGVVDTARAMTPQPGSKGVNGTLISYSGAASPGADSWNSNGCYLKINRVEVVPEDNAEFGRPLCSVKVLNTLSGFLRCADGEHDIAALAAEKDVISSYLTGGLYYE